MSPATDRTAREFVTSESFCITNDEAEFINRVLNEAAEKYGEHYAEGLLSFYRKARIHPYDLNRLITGGIFNPLTRELEKIADKIRKQPKHTTQYWQNGKVKFRNR